MASEKETQAALGRVIDNLLKKLPGADPNLIGDRARVKVSGVPHVAPGVRQPAAAGPTRGDLLAVWARVGLGLLLAGVVQQWPYGFECGLALFAYLFALAAVAVGGTWAAVWAWRMRMGVAHIVALLVIAWGLGLTAERVLPRTGYAAESASWRCS
jgi:hypothetical protein